jgi:outer membrane protein
MMFSYRSIVTVTTLMFLSVGLCAGFAMAQTEGASTAQSGSDPANMEVRRIALVDLDGILRASAASTRIRELLDEQRKKFQDEFRQIELDLQQDERDLMAKRDLIAKEEYDKLVAAFQERVTNVQKDIQYKRQAIDNAYQKGLNDIRKLAFEMIKEIAAERKLDMILNRDASVIFLPRLNISQEVLERLNERTKNARIEIEIKKPPTE